MGFLQSGTNSRGNFVFIEAGQALGVIELRARKSTLARLITGAMEPTNGEIRLGGARFELYSDQALGEYIGTANGAHVPRTIGENTTNLALSPTANVKLLKPASQ